MNAQPGILNSPAPYHIHLEYSFSNLDELDALRRIVQSEQASSAMRTRSELFGFSAKLWNALSTERAPSQYQPFRQIEGNAGKAPTTQGDLWVWFQGNSHSWNLDAASNLHGQLTACHAKRTLEVFGYVRHENRDFTGFIDGTENPKKDEAEQAALIPNGGGSSFAFTQNWIHDLEKFNSIDREQQEKVIGRTKADSIELDGDNMPVDSHVSRTDAQVDGIKQKIVRRSVPHGSIDAKGLHFVAFACDLGRITVQLERMYGASEDGLHDQLIHYSTPMTGSYWYVPSSGSLFNLR